MISKSRSIKRAIPAFGLALLASLALSSVVAGSASAATQYWYSCQNTGKKGGGPYEDSFCSKKVEGGTYKLNKLTAPTGLVLKNTTGFVLKWSLTGITFQVNCSSLQGEGTIENPTGKEGVASVPVISLSSCTVEAPKGAGCKLTGGGYKIAGVQGKATEFESKSAMNFFPGGGIFTIIEFEGCQSPWTFLNGSTYQLSGNFTGIANNATSSLEFTKASTSKLTISGQPVSFEGASKMETTAGEMLKLAP